MTAHAEAQLPSKARLRWLCRRGMKELDVLLEPYFLAEFDAMTAENKVSFHALIELEDPQLYAYMMGRDTPEDPQAAALVFEIRDYRHKGALR